jgi:hypothetical protein
VAAKAGAETALAMARAITDFFIAYSLEKNGLAVPDLILKTPRATPT